MQQQIEDMMNSLVDALTEELERKNEREEFQMSSYVNEIDRELVELERKYGADALAECEDYEYLCHLLTDCEDDTDVDTYSVQEIARCLAAVKEELSAK